MNKAYLLLGSNAGDRGQFLQLAVEGLTTAGRVSAVSACYETAAWGKQDQPDFLNLALLLETALDAPGLLSRTQAIENELGRQRSETWGQRTLDIDILFFNDSIIDLPQLQIPHPHLQNRRFVLVPLCDIAADFRHPAQQKSIRELLAACPDPLEVRQYCG